MIIPMVSFIYDNIMYYKYAISLMFKSQIMMIWTQGRLQH